MNRLKQLAEQIEAQARPPVHLWKPAEIGKIDIKIDSSGNWFHEGEAILREKLVNLFSSILWFEDGQHFLVTPVEKLAIEVDDSAFVIHQSEWLEEAWVMVTNTHESIIVSEEHPVTLREYRGQWVPYVNVRYDLWARLNRSQFFQWVELALERQALTGDEKLVLQSNGYIFEVAR